ncbi:hypothetical protein EDD17DRAFT_12820 [Pisolithus thermaeus]|nr:hypothetical protein EDD17DRAFT_12820 [Pisolithus thermaeus]
MVPFFYFLLRTFALRDLSAACRCCNWIKIAAWRNHDPQDAARAHGNESFLPTLPNCHALALSSVTPIIRAPIDSRVQRCRGGQLAITG